MYQPKSFDGRGEGLDPKFWDQVYEPKKRLSDGKFKILSIKSSVHEPKHGSVITGAVATGNMFHLFPFFVCFNVNNDTVSCRGVLLTIL